MMIKLAIAFSACSNAAAVILFVACAAACKL